MPISDNTPIQSVSPAPSASSISYHARHPISLTCDTSIHNLLASCHDKKITDLADRAGTVGPQREPRTRSREHFCPRCAVASHSSPTPRPALLSSASPIFSLVMAADWLHGAKEQHSAKTIASVIRSCRSMAQRRRARCLMAALSTTSMGQQLKCSEEATRATVTLEWENIEPKWRTISLIDLPDPFPNLLFSRPSGPPPPWPENVRPTFIVFVHFTPSGILFALLHELPHSSQCHETTITQLFTQSSEFLVCDEHVLSFNSPKLSS